MRYIVYANGTPIYDPTQTGSSYQLISPSGKMEIGKAGSFEFTILPSHSFYDQFQQMKTVIRVVRDGVEMFNGRVLQISDDIFRQRKVYCEGNFSYFLDSVAEPVKEVEMSIQERFQKLIESHNSQVDDFKKFTAGNVTIDKRSERKTFNETTYQDTQKALDSLVSEYGGYFVTRTEEVNGQLTTYLDWVKEFTRTATQPIELTVNMLDYTHEKAVDDLYTMLYPTGDDDLNISSVNDNSKYLQNDSLVAKYGKIIHHEDFNGEDNANELKKKAQEFFADYLKKELETWSLKAVDLKFVDDTKQQILLGDKVHIVSPIHGIDINRVCTAISYSLNDPGNDTYDFGSTYQSLSDKHNTATKEAKAAEAALARDNKNFSKTLKDYHNRIEFMEEQVDIYGQTLNIHAQTLTAQAEQINLRATKEEVGELETKVNEAGIEIDGIKGQLDLYATQDQVNQFGQRVSNVEVELDAAKSTIDLKADSDVVDSAITDLRGLIGASDERIRQAEVKIDGQQAEINLKASQKSLEALESNVDANSGDLSKFKQSISSAGITIDGIGATIASKVEKDGVISSINQSSESVVINASKIDLQGYVTVTEMHTEYGTGDQLSVNDIDCDVLTCNSVNAAQYYVGSGEDSDSLTDAIKTVSIVGPVDNVYTLQYTTFSNDEPQDAGTFSRATTLTRGWSGGDLTVNATPQGNRFVHHLGQGPASVDANNILSIPIVYTENSDYDNVRFTGKTITVDISQWIDGSSAYELYPDPLYKPGTKINTIGSPPGLDLFYKDNSKSTTIPVQGNAWDEGSLYVADTESQWTLYDLYWENRYIPMYYLMDQGSGDYYDPGSTTLYTSSGTVHATTGIGITNLYSVSQYGTQKKVSLYNYGNAMYRREDGTRRVTNAQISTRRWNGELYSISNTRYSPVYVPISETLYHAGSSQTIQGYTPYIRELFTKGAEVTTIGEEVTDLYVKKGS